MSVLLGVVLVALDLEKHPLADGLVQMINAYYAFHILVLAYSLLCDSTASLDVTTSC